MSWWVISTMRLPSGDRPTLMARARIPIDRMLEKLGDDEQWKMFIEDCDLEGTNFDQFFQGKMNKVISLGQYGFLIDKSPIPYESHASEIKSNVTGSHSH